MAAPGEERVLSELKGCRESLGQIRNELTGSIGQLESQITGLRGSLAHARETYRAAQSELDKAHESTGGLESQLQSARSFDAKLSQMESTLAGLQCLPVTVQAPVQSGADFSTIKKALLALTEGSGQEAVLQAFLDQAAGVVKRAILFVNKENRFEAWRSHGFPADALGSLVVDDPKDPIMDAARTRRMVYREQAPADARPSLGADAELPNAFAAVPLVFDDYVPLILYADSDSPIDADYLEVLSYLAVLVLKNYSLQQGGEQPFVAPPTAEPVSLEPTPFEAEQAEEPEPEPEPAFEIPQEEPEPAPAPPPVPAAEDWEIPESMREERTPGVIEARALEPPRIEPQVAPVEPLPMPEPAPSAPPAAPVGELSAEEAEKYGNEARRFARLLVSEIKLYNEDEVYNGRQNSDLYLRLKRDVDRSREMYEKRVHPAIAKTADHFHEELIRILAREDASLMGPAYPGPMIRR